MVDWLNHQWLEPFGPAKCLFGRFLLTLSRIKRPQVMFMVKFSPTALNFGYDFVVLVHFLGHPVVSHCISLMVFCLFSNKNFSHYRKYLQQMGAFLNTTEVSAGSIRSH